MKSPEVRTVRAAVEFRASGGVGTLVGYAAKFNKTSRNLGGFVEEVAPAAFNKSLADGVRVMARYNHDDMGLLGTSDAGTLRMTVDGTGLLYEVDLPDTTVGRDCAVLAQRGDLRFSSFAFHVLEDEWGLTANEFPMRTLRSVQLVDVAPVNDPAYLDTSSGLRMFASARGLDLAEVRAAADRNDLRALLKKNLDAAPVEDTPQTPIPATDEIRAGLDERRARLRALALAAGSANRT